MENKERVLKYYTEFRIFWESLPLLQKAFNALIIPLSVFSICTGSGVLDFSPQKIFGQWPPSMWTLFTFGFYDTDILNFIIHLVLINYILVPLKSIWQATHFFLFLAKTIAIAGLLYALFFSLVSFITFGYVGHSLYTYSFATLQVPTIALLLALRQHFPERSYNTHIPLGESTLKIPYRHLAHYQILCNLCECIVFELPLMKFFISLTAYYAAWLCLRFIVKHELSRSPGDPSGQFALVEVLPPFLKPYLTDFCNECFVWVLKTGYLKDFNRRCLSGVLGESNEIERKRALERLNAEVEKIVRSEQPENEEADEEAKPLNSPQKDEDEDDQFGEFTVGDTAEGGEHVK